jgi:hypothetical protein
MLDGRSLVTELTSFLCFAGSVISIYVNGLYMKAVVWSGN